MPPLRLTESIRARAKDAAVGTRMEEPLRRIKRVFEPGPVARDRRDMEHLRAVLPAVLAPDSNCIDVGAHEGAVLADLVRLAPRGRHIAYEPLPHLHARLCARFPELDVRQAALSDHEGEARFVHVVTRPGWSGFRERPYPGNETLEQIVVPVEQLDKALPSGYAPNFIKIDVEGAEREALAGAVETLAVHRPIVVFEHGLGSADFYGTRPETVFSLLTDRAALRIFDLDGGGPYTLARFVGAFEQAERVNFLARP